MLKQPCHHVFNWIETEIHTIFFAEIDGFSVDVHGATIGSTASRQRNAETTT